MSTWLHIKAYALYPLYSMAFPKLKFKISKNLNTFELVTTSFYNWGLHHWMYCPLSQYYFIRFAIIFVSSLRANTCWSCDLNLSNTCEFSQLLQVTFTNDLILNTIWLLIAWLVHRLKCKYSLLHLSHGTSVLKPLLALHLRLVPRSPFLAIFTLSSHTQVTSY